MVNFPKMDLSPDPAGHYGKWTMKSTLQRHQVNKGKSGWKAAKVRELGEFHSLRKKIMPSTEEQWEMHCSSNEEKEEWIEDYVDRETAVARNPVQDAETAIMQAQDHRRNIEKVRSKTTKPEIT